MPEGLELPKDKRVLYGGAALVILIVAVVYYRSKTSASTTSTSNTTSSTSIDPQTGYAYGSAEDNAALASMAANAGYTDTGYGYQTGTQTYNYSNPGTGFTSNGAWAQAAEDYLVNQTQADATTVAAALGKYISGQVLTSDQLNVVEQAIAFEGIPPQAGPDGYPPSFRQAPVTQGGGNPPSGGGVAATGPWNLVANVIGPTEVDLSWVSQNTPQYQINYGVNGNVNMYHYVVSGNSAKIGALKPGLAYIFNVQAKSGNSLSPASPEVTVTPH